MLAQVAFTLADKVLTSPQQEVKVLDVKQVNCLQLLHCLLCPPMFCMTGA